MALTHRWTGRNEADLIASVRLQCYALSQSEMPKFLASVLDDARAKDGEFLLVESSGVIKGSEPRAVGTATSLSLTLHTKHAALPCHGVAYVGTIRTERRKGTTDGPGIATLVMQHTLARARERGDVVTALMPFRASYYEHFGYGNVEHQANWTIPLDLLPSGDAGFWTPYQPEHLSLLEKARVKTLKHANCDIDRPESQWRNLLKRAENGFAFLCLDNEGECDAWTLFNVELEAGVPCVKVLDWGVTNPSHFNHLLRFFGSLRDQYARVRLPTPVDVPVNHLLRESQIPYRPVAHAACSLSLVSRMQMRVLDHKRYLEALHWPMHVRGEEVVSIRESEGHESRFLLTVENGRASVSTSQMTPTFTTTDKTWAAVVSGHQPASALTRFGLATGDPALLDALSTGPKPFCADFF